jgi:single-stranded-DNA-specific exonuclease
VIVTDHHLPGESLPPAYAIINPKQDMCSYPDTMLCGAGVAFKLVQAFLARYGDTYRVSSGQEKWLLDMVGLATLSDMVPLVNENRVFAYYGLKVIQKTKREFLVAP